MSTKVSSFKRYSQDHFVPDVSEDTAAQRRLRGQLEQIDYTAYASNKEVVGAMLGHADAQKFQRILEIVLKHARHNQYRFVLTASRGPGEYDIAMVDMTAKGGFEVGSGHYPLIVLLHAAWLGGLWYLVLPATVSWPWIMAYLVLEAARGWIIAALGNRWTTRIIVVPGETLIDEGPYKYFRHPNYLVVAGEIFILPMAFGLWWYAVPFAALNAALLYWRIRSEDAALAPLRQEIAQSPEDPTA